MNARKHVKNGVTYLSGLELYCSDQLDLHKIPYEYEKETYVLQERTVVSQPIYKPRKVKGFKVKQLVQISKICLPIRYTPDFIVEKNGVLFIIECKGLETDTFKIKLKLFKKYMHDNDLNCVYMTPSTKTQVRQSIEIIQNHKP